MKKKPFNRQISEEQIDRIIKFRAHGHSYATISEAVGVGKTTARKYGQNIKILPLNMQKDVQSLLRLENPRAKKKSDEKMPTDLDYYLDDFEEGDRFIGPLDKISLIDLQNLMKVPTDYHSPLSMGDWAIKYLGGRRNRFLTHPPHLWCKTQMEIFELWEEHRLLMVECFRDVGKTMAADAILPHEMCEHRDNNYFIMSETRQKAGFRVKHIGDVLLTNKLLIADYGFLPHIAKYGGYKQAWKSDQITIKREFKQTDPSLMAFSSDSSNATGAHFAGGVFDDVWSFNLEQNCEKNKEKWLGWYDGELVGCLENAWELWLLTRKGVLDLYQDMEDRQFHAVIKRPAVIKFPSDYKVLYKKVGDRSIFDKVVVYSNDYEITDDGNGRFSIEFFIEKMTKMDKLKWESEYQLNPLAATGKFWKWKDLRFMNGYTEFYNSVKNYTGSKRFKIIGFMDIATGITTRADFTALVIVALWENKFHFLELYLKRGATERDMIKMFAEACRSFPELRTIYVEDDLWMSDKIRRIKNQCGFVNLQGFSSRQETARLKKEDSTRRVNLNPKAMRIWWQLEDSIGNNKLYINKKMRNFKEFRDEYTTFPSCKHFDVLDALGNACSILEQKGYKFWILSG